ncbi:alpha/beta hydrolase family protein [Streptomyces lycii]|uniref:Alpha/beta fold hydrolase n=1 Tax=Streptomyces lycii TaxID=2654337 RepID=A0ABQ7FAY9_9ACTN|nr:alpha/beta fold hydrolase [Streptomyces lycii]KAF4405494.1 alpha/beta fold hydrolase [Streptomyces lycii]
MSGAAPAVADRSRRPAQLWDALTTLRSRFGFRFSATGRRAAALVTDGRGRMFLETWDLRGDTPDCRAVPGFERAASNVPLRGRPTDVVPFDDGSVLVLVARPGCHDLVAVQPDGGERVLGTVPGDHVTLAAPPDGRPGALLLARVGDDPAAACTAWTLAGSPSGPPVRAGELPALLLRGGGWLDPAGERFQVNVRDAGRIRPAAFHVRDGRHDFLYDHPGGSGGDTVLLTAPESGVLLAATERNGRHVLCAGPASGPLRVLSAPDRLAGEVRPLALRGDGRWAVLRRTHGLACDLFLLDTHRDTVRPLAAPAGRVLGPVAWRAPAAGADEGPPRLWCLSVGADTPARLLGATVSGAGDARRAEADDGTPAGRWPWAPGHVQNFPGPAGDIEALVCGHEDWRTARHVVLALHGGPAGMWRLKFHQLFQVFADAGVTVIAPNPRGSIGYGQAFHEHVVNAWGGPDLADVLHLAGHIRGRRPTDREPPALYGHSYGAFLALLAACAAPGLWSRVAAVAPFLSGESLYRDAAPPVRAMIDRLGGRRRVADEHGPRDLAEPGRLSRLSAPLLILHGDRDDVVPAGQSRALARRLAELGAVPGVDFHHHEVSGAGHTPLDGSRSLHLATARFLAAGGWSP